MRAITYHGAHDFRVESVPDPILEAPDDIILRVTAMAIGGSDLHLYRGKMPTVENGDIRSRVHGLRRRLMVPPSGRFSVVIES